MIIVILVHVIWDGVQGVIHLHGCKKWPTGIAITTLEGVFPLPSSLARSPGDVDALQNKKFAFKQKFAQDNNFEVMEAEPAIDAYRVACAPPGVAGITLC